MAQSSSAYARNIGIIALQQANANRQSIVRFIRRAADAPLRDELDAKGAASSVLQNTGHVGLDRAFGSAKDIAEKSEKSGIAIISSADEAYPAYLRLARDHPFILYAKGNVGILASENTLGIIGAREASQHGKWLSWDIASWFAKKNFAVISGLSLGIDADAHRGAVFSEGKTIALLAHGLDTVFPKENTLLAERILHRGALVSEHPIGVGHSHQQFLHRNRIFAGMVLASVIIECLKGSGTMHTADEVRKKGRLLYAVLPDATAVSPEWKSEGPDHLLSRKLAMPIGMLNIEGALSEVSAAIEAKKAELLSAKRLRGGQRLP